MHSMHSAYCSGGQVEDRNGIDIYWCIACDRPFKSKVPRTLHPPDTRACARAT
jgi:hypothetical protein